MTEIISCVAQPQVHCTLGLRSSKLSPFADIEFQYAKFAGYTSLFKDSLHLSF